MLSARYINQVKTLLQKEYDNLHQITSYWIDWYEFQGNNDALTNLPSCIFLATHLSSESVYKIVDYSDTLFFVENSSEDGQTVSLDNQLKISAGTAAVTLSQVYMYKNILLSCLQELWQINMSDVVFSQPSRTSKEFKLVCNKDKFDGTIWAAERVWFPLATDLTRDNRIVLTEVAKDISIELSSNSGTGGKENLVLAAREFKKQIMKLVPDITVEIQ